MIGPAQPDLLHLMTFNIRYNREDATAAGDPDHWPDRAPLLKELLSTARPTLLGAQEVLFSQLPTMLEALPSHEFVGHGREGGSHGEYAPIFYDSERLELREWDQYWLSDTPATKASVTWDHDVTRVVTWARFAEQASGKEFIAINTHFDHESETARAKSARALARQVAAVPDGLPVLLTGDFNADAARSEAYDVLVGEAGMRDALLGAEKRLSPVTGTVPTYRAPSEDVERIDWILASPSVSVLQAGINGFNVDGRYPSDHVPVHALIRLP